VRCAPRTSLTRVLAIDIDAGFREAPLTAHSALPALHATGINTNNGVRGMGRGSGAGGWGCGQGAVRMYASTYASTRRRPAMCRACITAGVYAPFTIPPPPKPWRAPDSFSH